MTNSSRGDGAEMCLLFKFASNLKFLSKNTSKRNKTDIPLSSETKDGKKGEKRKEMAKRWPK